MESLHTPREDNTPKEGELLWQQERVKLRLWMKAEAEQLFPHARVCRTVIHLVCMTPWGSSSHFKGKILE